MLDEKREHALLLGLNLNDGEDFERSMSELSSLCTAAGIEVDNVMTQNLPQINASLYMGRGKLGEAQDYMLDHEIDVVVFDRSLTPSQTRNLENILDHPILDRTTLILEIFAERARTKEARMQVEYARLQYILPRLTGMHRSLSRQGGTSGGLSNRGAGETKLELDRRRVEKRMSELRKDLEKITSQRETQRKQRQGSGIPRVALVGYTNAGKSTLMNCILDKYIRDPSKRVLEKDMLFATLDTTVRRISTGKGRDFLLSDTVGFIHQLPTDLIKAFRSTLEEAKEADLLLIVLDYSDENYHQQKKVTEDTLRDLGAGDIPVIYIYNKADRVMSQDEIPFIKDNRIYMSAKTGNGLKELISMIEMKTRRNNYDTGRYF